MIFFFFDYIDLSFDNSHNELQLDELPSNDDDKLLKQIQTIQAAYRNGIDQNIEDLMVNRAFARDSLRMRYDSYVYGLEFYDLSYVPGSSCRRIPALSQRSCRAFRIN